MLKISCIIFKWLTWQHATIATKSKIHHCFNELQVCFLFKWHSCKKCKLIFIRLLSTKALEVLGNSFRCWKFQFPRSSTRNRCQMLPWQQDWTPYVVRYKMWYLVREVIFPFLSLQERKPKIVLETGDDFAICIIQIQPASNV